VSAVPEPKDAPPPSRNRLRDFWQLDVPLAVVLVLCTAFTVIEARRAGDGVWRAWVYLFEWPLIAAFSVWIWHRFRTEGNPVQATTQRWRDRVALLEAEAAAEDAAAQEARAGEAEAEESAAGGAAAPASAEDPGIAAWRAYQRDLHRREPPGGPQ
jgi:hypothetical protein